MRTYNDMLGEMRQLLSDVAHTPDDLDAFADYADRWARDLRREADLWRRVGTERFRGTEAPLPVPARLGARRRR